MMACTSPAFTDEREAIEDDAILIGELDVEIFDFEHSFFSIRHSGESRNLQGVSGFRLSPE